MHSLHKFSMAYYHTSTSRNAFHALKRMLKSNHPSKLNYEGSKILITCSIIRFLFFIVVFNYTFISKHLYYPIWWNLPPFSSPLYIFDNEWLQQFELFIAWNTSPCMILKCACTLIFSCPPYPTFLFAQHTRFHKSSLTRKNFVVRSQHTFQMIVEDCISYMTYLTNFGWSGYLFLYTRRKASCYLQRGSRAGTSVSEILNSGILNKSAQKNTRSFVTTHHAYSHSSWHWRAAKTNVKEVTSKYVTKATSDFLSRVEWIVAANTIKVTATHRNLHFFLQCITFSSILTLIDVIAFFQNIALKTMHFFRRFNQWSLMHVQTNKSEVSKKYCSVKPFIFTCILPPDRQRITSAHKFESAELARRFLYGYDSGVRTSTGSDCDWCNWFREKKKKIKAW